MNIFDLFSYSLKHAPIIMPTTVQLNLPSLDDIRRKTLEILGYRPCLWQCKVVNALLQWDKDIISITSTGSGKTMTFWMPLLFCQWGIIIVITPLNILGEQSVWTLAKLGIKGISMTAETAMKQNFKVRTLSWRLCLSATISYLDIRTSKNSNIALWWPILRPSGKKGEVLTSCGESWTSRDASLALSGTRLTAVASGQRSDLNIRILSIFGTWFQRLYPSMSHWWHSLHWSWTTQWGFSTFEATIFNWRS